MLFNSLIFILVFLPITVAGYYLLTSRQLYQFSLAWLVAASLCFYGFWEPAYLALILGSITFNYLMGTQIRRVHSTELAPWLVGIGIAGNLLLIAYYKYANFFIANINAVTGSQLHMVEILLPLAISFFTFQQIAYLVDCYRGQIEAHNFLQYSLFVTFFPQLIAGPIVHHKEMLPQFKKQQSRGFQYDNLAVGLTIFAIGLFKKVVLADSLAVYADPVFLAAESGEMLTASYAWTGTIAYTLQLYFDFSGYSDMAIGLARLFGIRLPLNFNSPYKASSIVDFWRAWHMTLSRFLRDYLYIPLGGNRHGPYRRYLALVLTMLLGGLWHGAGWTFVLWGALHGAYLVINHGWRALRGHFRWSTQSSLYGTCLARMITFIAIAVAWVLFRAESLDGALQMLSAMFGGGVASTQSSLFDEWTWLSLLLVLVLFAPNTQQIMSNYDPALETYPGEVKPLRFPRLGWRPNAWLAIGVGIILVISLKTIVGVPDSPFLYFNF